VKFLVLVGRNKLAQFRHGFTQILPELRKLVPAYI
jgi:hypothetical protein